MGRGSLWKKRVFHGVGSIGVKSKGEGGWGPSPQKIFKIGVDANAILGIMSIETVDRRKMSVQSCLTVCLERSP